MILFTAFAGDMLEDSHGKRTAKNLSNVSAAGEVLYLGFCFTQSMNWFITSRREGAG
jgi:hypothetical protein